MKNFKELVEDSSSSKMNTEESQLWQKIKSFKLDDVNASFSFVDRLRRENGWSYEFALRAVLEYKKFMFLICVTPHPLTPSNEVDQVWHLHLLYTESYWEDFCDKTLNQKIHHGPTKGGGEERDKFTDWYQKTKEVYREKFHINPPEDLWPSSEIRFSELNFRRVNLHRNWVIPKFFIR